MSTPVNANITLLDPRITTPELALSPIKDRFANPYLKDSMIDVGSILQPPPAPPAPVTVEVHGGEKGAVSGNVSYTPGDFASMQAAAEELMKSGNEKDYLDGQKLLNQAYRILYTEQLIETKQQEFFNSVKDALMRG